MLEKVLLHNFKCYAEQSFDMAPLTLLTGVNNAGKSSFIQALLALEQSSRKGDIGNTLVLSGHLVNLGLPRDVHYENAQDETLSITLQRQGLEYAFCYHRENWEFIATKDSCTGTPFACFTYLCAERTGPRTAFPIPTREQTYYNKLGNAGQFATHILEEQGSELVTLKKLILSDAQGTPLPHDVRSQTEAWLMRISRPLRVHTQRYTNMDQVGLEFSFTNTDTRTANYRASNVGFGLTYALPIFVAVLSAKPGDIIIIENPEAHLHPKGQAIVGEFLARAAASGVQLIVETHSDHLLNGVRVAVKHEKLLDSQVIVHFFTVGANGQTKLVRPRLDKDGRFDFWPDDFFDEWDKQLTELL